MSQSVELLEDLDAVRVLHVDDDRDYLDLTEAFIAQRFDQLEVETTTSPRAALDRFDEAPFDCVIADYEMADLDGLELLVAIRERDPELPVVLFTDNGSEEVASEAIAAGVTDYFRKTTDPSTFTVLAHRIASAVRQYRAKRALAESEETLSLLAEKSDDILFMFNGDWSELLFINSAYEDIWGAPIEELERDPTAFVEYVHPEDRSRCLEAMDRLEAGERVEIEYRVERPDGDTRWIYGNTVAILDADGTVDRIVGHVRDVTDRVGRERELAAFEQAVDNAGLAIYWTDVDGHIEYVNHAFEEQTGYRERDVLGTKRPFVESDPQAGFDARDIWMTVLSGRTWEGEGHNRRASGERYPVHAVVSPVYNDEGDLTRVVAIEADISDTHQREQQLVVLHRVLKHDIKNNLDSILLATALLQDSVEDEEAQELLSSIEHTAGETLALSREINEMREVFESPDSVTTAVDIAGVLRRQLGVLEGEHPAVETTHDLPDRSFVLSNRIVGRAVRNVLQNAVEHNDQTPVIEVSMREVDGAEEVALDVADNGPGISPRERAMLEGDHEALVQHAKGFGLWLVRWILSLSGGRLEFADNEPRGTVVTMVFPRATPPDPPH